MVAPGAVMPRACAAIRREIGLAACMPECLDVARVVVVGDIGQQSKLCNLAMIPYLWQGYTIYFADQYTLPNKARFNIRKF